MSRERHLAAMRYLGRLVLEDGQTWDASAADYQMADAAAILDEDATVRQHWSERPRGGRKSTDAAGILLAALAEQAPDRARAFIQAADEEQAADVVDAAAGLVSRMPAETANEWDVTGRRITYLPKGATATAVAMDASAMGKRPYLVVVDELGNWPDLPRSRKQWDVMTSAVLKVPSCRLCVFTNSMSPGHFSSKLVERFEKSRHWRVNALVGGLPWLSEDDHERLRELATTDEEYRRLHLNERISSGGRLTTMEQVRAAAVLPTVTPPRPGVRYVAGLDIGVVNDATALVVAHCEPRDERWDGYELRERYWTVVVDRIDVWKGTRKEPVDLQRVEAQIAAIAYEYGAAVVYDPHQAVLLGQRLRAAGVLAEPFTFTVQGNAHLASTMVRLLRTRSLQIPADDEDLIDELLHVNLRQTSQGTLRMDHDAGRHDDRAVAIALAAQHLLDGTKAETTKSPRRLVVGERWAHARRSPGGDRDRTQELLVKLATAGSPTAARVMRQHQAQAAIAVRQSWR